MFGKIPESKEVQEQWRLEAERADTRNLEARVRRRLAQGGLRLHKVREGRQQYFLGVYYVTDRLGVMPILRRVDLRSLAQQLGVEFGSHHRWTQGW